MSVFDAQVVAPDLIYQAEADVFAPCATTRAAADQLAEQRFKNGSHSK